MTRAAKGFPLGGHHLLPESPSPLLHLPTSQHGLLLLGRADEAADAFDDLALGIHLLFSRFLAQEDCGNWNASRTCLSQLLEKQPSHSSLVPALAIFPGKGR